jgi:choice-of-anchor A domain-containing protein
VWAAPLSLSEAQDFNLLTWGNASLINSDTEGRVAVGGSAIFSSYSIGTHATNPTPTTASFIVAGDLAAGHGQVFNGSILVGGTYSGPGYALNSAAGSVTQFGMGSAVPFDFGAAKTALTAKSLAFGSEAETGTSILQWSTLTLTGSNADVNVFNVTAAELANASSIVLNATAGSRVLINVSGASATFSNKGLHGFTPTLTVFNFYEATVLNMAGIGVEGSILAPRADVSFVSGQMNGQLIANSFSGASWGVGELHNHPFNNQTPPPVSVPDGASTGLLVIGALVGAMGWKRLKG